MAEPAMTMGDLVEAPGLSLTVMAGAEGLSNPLVWAHSCEMPSPERWLDPAELLMTVGLCIPPTAEGQANFIRQIDEAGMAGLMLAAHDPMPHLWPELFQEAERRNFPVVSAPSRTAYAVVARHVAAANSDHQFRQVMRLTRLYEEADRAGTDLDRLLHGFSKVTQTQLSVVHPRFSFVLSSSSTRRSETSNSDARTRRHKMHSAFPWELAIEEATEAPLDSFLLVHLLNLVQVAVAREQNRLDRFISVGENMMSELLQTGHTKRLPRRLSPYSVADGYCFAAFPEQNLHELQLHASTDQSPMLLGSGRDHGLCLVPIPALDQLKRYHEQTGVPIGVSSTFYDTRDARAASVEAARVLSVARDTGQGWSEYEGSTMAVLSRSFRESQEIVSGVLGPLASTESRMSTLRETLFCFLRHDRHWTPVEDELGIHHQTLAQRLRKISELTGTSFQHTSDLSALWIASQAWQTLHGPSASGSGQPPRQPHTH
jgi:purine catabolism regulator